MTSINLKTYPSGFIGSSSVPQTELLTINSIKHKLFDSSPITNVPAHTANREVTSLWQDVLAGDTAYKTFEFREKILKCALAAFGTGQLYTWIVAQEKSNFHTGYHRQWIEETLEYVLTGKRRQYTENVWFSLIVLGDSDRAKLQSSTVIQQVMPGGPYHTLSIADFITMWAQADRGIDDMIASLHILFGKR
jgi:hypothetical protein